MFLLYSLYNGLALLHKYTSIRASEGVHHSTWWVRLSSCLGHTSAGRVVNCAVLIGCASSLEIPLASRGHTPRLSPSSEGLGSSSSAWGTPFRGMLTGPEAFLRLPGASGLQPCDWTYLKTTLCHSCTLGGAYNKYQFTNQRVTVTCDTICVVVG